VLRILSQARQKGITVIFTTPSVVQETAVGNHVAVLIIWAKAVDFRKGEKTHEVVTLNCPKFVEASLGQFYKQEDIHVRQEIHQRVSGPMRLLKLLIGGYAVREVANVWGC
jgi:hypothetical protein